MLSAWRLCSPIFGHTVPEMMSGQGAFLYGGRWNSKGYRCVYLGASLAQASMELLVHLGRSDVLHTYHKLEITFTEDLVEYIDVQDLPSNWAAPVMESSVQQLGNEWLKEGSSLLLKVPSAAVTGEYNYLVNPLHTDFDKLAYSEVTEFNYDHRLLK